MNKPKSVETKILDISEIDLLPRLTALEFQRVFDGKIKTQWFMDRSTWEEVRVRAIGDHLAITNDPLRSDTQRIPALHQKIMRDGIQFNTAIDMLVQSGLSKVGLQSIKERVGYVLDLGAGQGNIELDLDTYSSLVGQSFPGYLRIKAPSEHHLDVTIKYLNLSHSERRNIGPRGLVRHYEEINQHNI